MKHFLALFRLQKLNEKKQTEDYTESLRKTRAFYFSMLAIIGLFIYGSKTDVETEAVINAVSNLAIAYIVGVAAVDAIRYNKTPSIHSPEKQIELKERYSDR